jgi:CheY-like chemotaxis protein
VFRNVTQERAVDRMKSEFVSMVSHELRTPLTSIKGYVSLMLDDEVGALNEDQRDFLLIVQSNADRQVSLINALLDLTRIEAGKVELQQGPLDLAAIIHMVSTSFRPQLAAKKQQLSVAIDDHLPPLVGDSDRITQVVTNLVSNAHKYTPAGGEISVSVRANTDHVLLEVRDTGIGMTAEEQNQLFNKFFRAKNRATQEATGTGLGLAITRGLVELHGGKIGVTSAPGQGTTFSVALPVSSAAVSFDIEPPEVGLVRAGGRVLVVDDEPDIAHLIQRYLERGGYRVRVAANGSEALRMAQRDQPDLILLDVLLPDVDGFTVLEWLKMEPSTAAIPVVVLSIMPNNGQGTMLGAIDYLTKPVSKDVLVDHIRRILANGPAQRVLIADDDSDVRSLLARHLKQAGFTVLEAADGAEAIEVARAHNPHLALLDVHMPGVDGVAALQVLRSEEQTRDLPVIMLSATPGTMDTRRSAIEALGSELLRKPCTAEELARMIANGVKGVIA